MSKRHPWNEPQRLNVSNEEARRLDALSGRAVIPGRVLGTCVDPDGVLPDVVLAERDAVFVVPESLLPHRIYWDDEYRDEVVATAIDQRQQS